MARPKKEELSEENKQNTSKSQLSEILKSNKDEHYNFQNRIDWKISTGSLLLDLAVGGALTPSLVRLCGNFGQGKTASALEILRNFLNEVKNSKGFWMMAEGRGLSKENQERCGLKFVYSAEEWEVGTIFVLESNVYELFINTVKDLVKNNENKECFCFVVDSIDGLQLKNDMEKEISENNKVAGAPSLSKKMLQSLSLGMFKYGHLMILLSQVTSEIKIDPYAPTANRGGSFSGGNSLLHGADWIFEYQRTYAGDYILDNPNGKMNDGKTKTIGKWAKVILQKSMVETSRGQLIKYPIKFGRKPSGIWLEYEIVDMLSTWEFIKMGGAGWITITEAIRNEVKTATEIEMPEKIQGENNLKLFLEQNPKVTEFFINKFKNVLSSNA